jgi:hypothetical protein
MMTMMIRRWTMKTKPTSAALSSASLGYTELSAVDVQDKLAMTDPIDLLQTWDSDITLESACKNRIWGTHHLAVDGEVPVFQLSMSRVLILYQEWVRLQCSRGLSVKTTDKRSECAFVYNWQHALQDIKESIKLATKSEYVLKFNMKD